MALFKTVILLLVAHTVHCRIITINSVGVDSDQCCIKGVCQCGSLSHALLNLSDNTIINITSSIVLETITQIGSGMIENITIIGNHVTISCNGQGAIHCESCTYIAIEGIIWDNCGKYMQSSVEYSGLHFTSVSNLFIKDCTFKHSRTGGVALYNASGTVKIVKVSFISNLISLQELQSRIYGALLVFYNQQDLNVTIVGSNYINNGYQKLPQYQRGIVSIHGVAIENGGSNPIENLLIAIENTTFIGNPHAIRIRSQASNASLRFSKLKITDSIEQGVYIYMLGHDLTPSFHSIDITSSRFTSNVNALILSPEANIKPAMISINNSIFESNVVTKRWYPARGILSIISSAPNVIVNISNCDFLNNLNGAIGVNMIPPKRISECNYQYVSIINTLVRNTTTVDDNDATEGCVSIMITDGSAIVELDNTTFEMNHYLKDDGAVLLISMNHGCGNPLLGPYNNITLKDCLFVGNNAFDDITTLEVIGNDDYAIVRRYFTQIINSNFDGNTASYSILYINVDVGTGLVNIIASNFINNIGGALYYYSTLQVQFSGVVQFTNNTAELGAAIHFAAVSGVTVNEDSKIYFTNNSVNLYGGAIYFIVMSGCTYVRSYFNTLPNNSDVYFVNNSADIAGSSIYYDIRIPRFCATLSNTNNNNLLQVASTFNYSQPSGANFPIITSPCTIKLDAPTVSNDNDSHYFIQTKKMLGESITFTASVFDYFNHSAEPVIFHMRCDTCGSDYVLSKDQISVASNSLQEFKVFPKKLLDVTNSTYINITMTSLLSPVYKQLEASLAVELSPCHGGYQFDGSFVPPQCVCYPHSDIVRCNRDYSEIRTGYWVGNVAHQYTSSLCPNNYCNFEKREETSLGYFTLPNKLDDQCSSHRTGVACGECISGYTLAYDSPNCINNNKCSAGITVLVVLLTIIYWTVIVAVVFLAMYFNNRVLSGYVYGIIYYYSIVDILLDNNLYISEGAFQVIAIISSFAKLNPEMFGQLCFVEGLSGIDQQFIHYSHAVAVSLIILSVVIAARYSLRIARYISRCIIRVISLLMLLSYTSLASTSLQLLRPLTFNDVDEVRTILSPEIKYFTGRHLIYAIVALLCEVLVIGLPLLLLFEPLIRKKITLTRIKPLLDQFQGCFKDKHHWFAAYYLICRQVIILIVYVGNSNYYNMLFYLQTACIIIAMIHFWFQPYKNDLLNALDGIVLLMLVLVVNLNTFTFFSSATAEIAIILVLLPLFLFLFIAFRQLIVNYMMNKKSYNQYQIHEIGTLHLGTLR